MKTINETPKTTKEILIDAFEDRRLLNDYLDSSDIFNNDFETSEEIQSYIEDRITEVEIIYYSNAMKFLSENDSSLGNSLEIADGMGYDLKSLSSELLATLLVQDMLREELYDFITEIESLF